MIKSAGVLFWRKNTHAIEVLLCRPSSDIHESNYQARWSIPKGNIDEGETPSEAAKREVTEEIGFKWNGYAVPQYGGEAIYRSGKKKLIYFTYQIFKAEDGWYDSWDQDGLEASGTQFRPSVASWEIDAIAWYPIHQALDIAHEAIIPIIKEICDGSM